jgi:hypothetical protein
MTGHYEMLNPIRGNNPIKHAHYDSSGHVRWHSHFGGGVMHEHAHLSSYGKNIQTLKDNAKIIPRSRRAKYFGKSTTDRLVPVTAMNPKNIRKGTLVRHQISKESGKVTKTLPNGWEVMWSDGTKSIETKLDRYYEITSGEKEVYGYCPKCKEDRQLTIISKDYITGEKKYKCSRGHKFLENERHHNPGAAWHAKKYDNANADVQKYGLSGDVRNQDMASGRASAHLNSYIESKQERIPNPSNKDKMFGRVLIIGLIGFIAYKIYKNGQWTV